MVNKEKGQVELKAGDESFILRFGWNEIAEVETLLDIGSFWEDLAPKFEDPKTVRGAEWRALLWAAMGGSASGRSILDVGQIMNRCEVTSLMVTILQAVNAAFPDPETVPKNPQTASPSAGMTQ